MFRKFRTFIKNDPMKHLLFSSILFSMLVLFSSFRDHPEQRIVGTYAVSEDDPSAIRLNLMEDHTYTYQDLSNPRKAIRVSGTWATENNRVRLHALNSHYLYHSTWVISADGMVAKSRKGLSFYRLCRVQ